MKLGNRAAKTVRLLSGLVLATLGVSAPMPASLMPATVAPAVHADDGVIAEWQGTTLIGRAQNQWHWWGSCRVQDMNGGAWGWYLRGSTSVTAPSYRIHHGMLAGYTATGGPNGVGCTTSNEFAWAGGVRQNFSNGFLYWQSGMSRAVAARNGTPAGYALARLGQVSTSETSNGRWSGWCLRFSYLANGRQWSTTDRAIWEWNEAVRRGVARAGDRNPPVGAIVYYSWADYGHAGIHVGDGWVVSTQGQLGEAKPVRIHRFDGIGLPYLGWAPPL